VISTSDVYSDATELKKERKTKTKQKKYEYL
jgi:hypothetical protein